MGFAQFTIPEKPSFQTSVYDYANVMEAGQKKQLEEKLVRYSDSTTTQIVVITIEDLKGEDIGILTPKWAHEWGIGQAKEDNGILILLSKNDRKIWIAPGYGVEDRLTAGITGELVRNIIIPEFKAGSYYNGLDKGADAIFDVLKGKYKGERKGNNSSGGGKIIFFIILFRKDCCMLDSIPTLSLLETRVLGTLVEKQRTVPDTYPLSLNALAAGCNQKTSRNPVTEANEAEILQAIDDLARGTFQAQLVRDGQVENHGEPAFLVRAVTLPGRHVRGEVVASELE